MISTLDLAYTKDSFKIKSFETIDQINERLNPDEVSDETWKDLTVIEMLAWIFCLIDLPKNGENYGWVIV